MFRKTLLFLFLAGSAVAQTTTTYTGVIKDLSQQVVTSGLVTFTLTQSTDSTIPGNGRFIPTTVSCNINVDGTLSAISGGACVVTMNTALSPSGTSYRICIQPEFSTPGSCFFDYATTASKDITTIVPTLSTGPLNFGGVPGPPIDFTGIWDSGTAYRLGQAVSFNNQVYISLVSHNLNNTPSSSPSQWAVVISPASLMANPTSTQTVTQPVNTNFNIVTSGTGSIQHNGVQIIDSSPFGSQTISQPAGTTFSLNNFNNTAIINGNGTADNTAAVQTAVNACAAGATCSIQLNNVVVAGSVNIPATSNYDFTGTLSVKCTGSGANCFERDWPATGNAAALFRIRFHGMKFVKSNTGAVIADLMVFSSAGNQGMTIDHNTFVLTGSAIGWLTQGSTMNFVTSNSFTSFTDPSHTGGSADRSGVAIQTQGANGSFGTMVTTVGDNVFNYMTGIKANVVVGAQDAWEGWSIRNNQFILSPVTVGSGNEINFVSNSFVASTFTISGNQFNSSILGNYFDSNVGGSTMLVVNPTLGQVAALQIQDNHFELGSGPNETGISFLNAGNLVTGVTITGNNYSAVSFTTATSFSITSNVVTIVTANNFTVGETVIPFNFTTGTYLNEQSLVVLTASATQFTATFAHANVGSTADAGNVFPLSYGIRFADSNVRNVYVGAENFRLTWAALQFEQTLDRSTIESFEARDVFYYAHNIATFAGTFLIAPHLYNVVPVSLLGFIPTAGLAAHNIASTVVTKGSMFPGPIITMAAGTCTTGATPLLSFSANGAVEARLQVDSTSPSGQATCDATVTFNGSKYVAPR